jgi:hypothetical protein
VRIPLVSYGTTSVFDVPIYSGNSRTTDLSALTRCTLEAAGVTVDSDTDAAAIDWTAEDAQGFDVIRCVLGGHSFPPGLQGARLTLYAPEFDAGKFVTQAFPVEFTT